MSFIAIIVAAGQGRRFGAKKQWMLLDGTPVFEYSVTAFKAAGASSIIAVVSQDDLNDAQLRYPDIDFVIGGADRAQSVKNALKAVKANNETLIMIHDAARPLLKPRHIHDLLEALQTHRAAILALPVSDTLKKVDKGVIISTQDRSQLYRAQTPQAFRLGDINAAYAAWPSDTSPTDEASVLEAHCVPVAIVTGDDALHKLTTPADFTYLKALIDQDKTLNKRIFQTRIGQGYDAHRFGPGQSVILCGVEISHDHGLVGHSDADVALHALTDALLGAASLGDIGDHFPPTDPQWRGAPSDIFLKHAQTLITDMGGQIINIDLTLICEQPKIKPHREAMRQNLSKILQLDISRISLKATTTEKMGFTGREEGMAAMAVCLIELPVFA